ncbi:WD repeat-containing and planar cell polarity effector protein fritz homolog [Cimex lectularius]|uniref:WD repeat-containing and planar cell polarity effector protein fritz n=1 Tax=Cimex lectularius TaxID=79782 RepID=A0A8I6RPR3_CIMLE|nr:WD repeat-containing and planar cell polarity effector protein fritz homolog [Cimex lectularius]
MFCLLHEFHFWTQKDGISVDNLDFGAFVYGEKKNVSNCPIIKGKKAYAQGRDINWSLSNKRPKKLRDNLKEFEDLLLSSRILNISWRNPTSIQILFGNGLLCYIQLNPSTGDINEFIYDKYMIGKLVSHYVSDVILGSKHAIFVYTDNQITVVYFTKPSLRFGLVKKWSSLDMKINTEHLSGPSGRRLEKQLSLNASGDLISVWWKTGNDEVYPWSPVVREEDRANIHVYSLNGTNIQLYCFYRSECEPIAVQFSVTQSNVIFVFQQRITKKSEVTIEWLTSEVHFEQFETNYSLSLQIPTYSCVLSLSPKEDKLLVACIDGSLLIADSYGNLLNTIKITFIPTIGCWHPDGCLLLIGNERGQLQWFDSYLNCVRSQFLSEDSTPSAVLDIGSFFKYQPTLLSMTWNRKSSNVDSHSDDLLLLHFERGPLVIVKLITGYDGCKRLSSDVIVSQYLKDQNAMSAVNLLYTIDWEHEGQSALSSLQLIISNQLKHHLTPDREAILEKALGSYHNPFRPIPQSIQGEFGDSVYDLTRRFFHHLLRYQVFEKAFRLAIDLDDHDLFMDIHNYCKKIGNTNMATAALERAEEILYSNESDSSSSGSSNSNCSSYSESTESSLMLCQPAKKTQPLPLLCTSRPPPRNQIKFPNKISHTFKYQVPTESTISEISPNAVGIPTVGDYDSMFMGNMRRDSKLNNQLYSTSFITDIKELPPIKSVDAPSQDQEVKKLSVTENGKIKVVHFGLV